MSTHKSSSPQEASVSRFESAHIKTVKARASLPPESILPINLDVNVLATTVMGVSQRLRDLREDVAQLHGINMAQYDKIEVYAEALAQAQANFLIAKAPAEPLPALVARAVELRDQLSADATALARHKLIEGKALSELKGGTGYLNAGTDLGALASMLRARWNDIQGKSAITAEHLDEAQQLFEDIMHAYGERSQTAERVASASDDRARAYTLLVSAYDQARRAITFLRWEEGDADKIAPSLWSGRGGRGGAPKPVDPPADGTTTPTVPTTPPATTPVTPTAPVTPTDTQPSNGMPGGSPFAHS